MQITKQKIIQTKLHFFILIYQMHNLIFKYLKHYRIQTNKPEMPAKCILNTVR